MNFGSLSGKVGGWVAQTGEGVVCNDVAQDPVFQGCRPPPGFTTRSILCAPLKQHDQIIGVIQALNTVSPEGFSAEDAVPTALGGWLVWRSCARRRSPGCATRGLPWEVLQERYRLVSSNAPDMQEALRIAHTVAATNTTVLLLGESGTGKEVVARAIHQWSPRAEHPSLLSTAWRSRRICWRASCLGMKREPQRRKRASSNSLTVAPCSWTKSASWPPICRSSCCRVLQTKSSVLVASETFALTYIFWLPRPASGYAAWHLREDLYYRLNVVAITLLPSVNGVPISPLTSITSSRITVAR